MKKLINSIIVLLGYEATAANDLKAKNFAFLKMGFDQSEN